jgi:ADP-ribose pyrophosphatase YjhB (NUDIX family)
MCQENTFSVTFFLFAHFSHIWDRINEFTVAIDITPYLPGISVDCVIFGFHENQLKVLLLRMINMDQWALPGGFIKKREDVDQAAVRILQERTGLKNIFLQQFHLFGEVSRHDLKHVDNLVDREVIPKEIYEWFSARFVTTGYYALVEYSKVKAKTDDISDKCEWFGLDDMPPLILDHERIIIKALTSLRLQLKFQPVGKNLLPEKFTMPELQALYETILGQKLDRRNFQRKILGYDILKRLEERRTGGAHKAPYLYSFDEQRYEHALEEGLKSVW